VTDQPKIVAVSTSPPDHGQAFDALTPGAPMKLFLSSMLHELHQPLVAIRLCAESGRAHCEGGGFSVEKVGALFEAVGESVEMTLRAIGGLRGYVKGQEPTISPIDLNQAVSEVIRLATIVARSRGIALVELLEPGLGRIWANRGALEQALSNLVFNAIEAIDEQGERRVSVSTRSAGDAIEVVVTDTGCGIAPDHQDKVFEPEFTTKPQGSGLGLAIAREVIAQQGGALFLLRSRLGEGTSFCLRLPARTSQSESAQIDALPHRADHAARPNQRPLAVRSAF
jgi:signal transduction histidine kinase